MRAKQSRKMYLFLQNEENSRELMKELTLQENSSNKAINTKFGTFKKVG